MGRLKGLLVVCVAATAPVLLVGCGGGGSSTSSAAAELQAAKVAGEESAHEKDRLDSLQRQVKKLRHQMRGAKPASSSPPSATGTPTTSVSAQAEAQDEAPASREFHVESGNVSCEVETTGATCTVEPISATFTFEDGEVARTEPSAALPLDLGEVVPYGSTVSVGSVSCEIPPSNVPHGVVCSDSATGHGFEASRVESRQKVY